MKSLKTFILISMLISILILSSNAKPLYLIIGETGVGKSSFVNWYSGSEIAKEGRLSSITSQAETYSLLADRTEYFIDTPGFLDTNGLTEQEILSLIQTEILKNRQELKTDHVSGILMIVDATQNRIRVRSNIAAMIKMLGQSSLKSVMIVINKIESVPQYQRQDVIDFVTQEIVTLGISPNQISLIDTKQPLYKYSPSLRGKLKSLQPYKIDGIERLERQVEAYYRQELNNQKNYLVLIEQVPKIIMKTVSKTVMKDEPYSYECNCNRVCQSRLFGICFNTRLVCSQCWSTRKVPGTIIEQVPETVYEEKTVQKLKNEEKYYRELAKDRLIKEVRDSVFRRKPEDDSTKGGNHCEL